MGCYVVCQRYQEGENAMFVPLAFGETIDVVRKNLESKSKEVKAALVSGNIYILFWKDLTVEHVKNMFRASAVTEQPNSIVQFTLVPVEFNGS